MSPKSSQKSGSIRKDRGLQGLIRLADFTAEDNRPEMALYVLARNRKLIHTAPVDEENRFEIPDEVLKNAHMIALGPETENFATLKEENLMLYRADQFQAMLSDFPELIIAKPNWQIWWYVTRCVTGSVTHCHPYPWLVAELVQQAVAVELPKVQQATLKSRAFAAAQKTFAAAQKTLTARQQTQISDLILAKPIQAIFPFYHCDPVCDGVVEVYRRVCCCKPWVLADPRLPRLIDLLEDIVLEYPPFPWPPIPGPDPAPFRTLPFFKDGALDEMAFNAKKDLAALRTLSEPQALEYIQARPYLFCWWSCGDPVKVADGPLLPNGKFNICWKDPLWFLFPNCHFEYAYVVKQNLNGEIVTIYDGVTAHKWFHQGDEPNLVSYHPRAIHCGQDPFPDEDGAFALLQDIGLAHSYRLKTPDATGWDRVAAPGYNDGLADPAANALAALGQYKDRNWGGTLYLRYHFSEDMRTLGAKYYRISVSAADSNGNPTGSRTPLSDALSWNKYVGYDIQPEVLGPFTAGGENNLFTIPYQYDADWHSGQYHGYLDTTAFADGRHLLTLEVFDAAGNRLRPTGTPGPGTDTAFTFRRWFQAVGPTANVPFAALTHMFWWDNRKAKAYIDDLRLNGSPSAEECQFLEGDANATFSVGYRAYHPEPMFLLNHSLWWRRGLGGPTGYLVNASPFNVGPAMGVSPTETFSNMLDLANHINKCSFSLNLYVNVKTFNGIGTLNTDDAWDYAAFALEIV
ncbi:MAG: hypothetical protein H6636_04965 [Anaerolineales bacterium]|nr:hypothetical protein [Anaerolineales bacterium]